MSMAAVTVMQCRMHKLSEQHNKEELELEQKHPGGTGTPAQNLKWHFLPEFTPAAFIVVTFCESSNIHLYIYRRELLTHRLFWIFYYILFASYYSYLLAFHYLSGHTETPLSPFDTLLAGGIFLYRYMAKAFCTWNSNINLYLSVKAWWYSICGTFFLAEMLYVSYRTKRWFNIKKGLDYLIVTAHITAPYRSGVEWEKTTFFPLMLGIIHNTIFKR